MPLSGLPLCSYDASVTQIRQLASVCEEDMSKVGGRYNNPLIHIMVISQSYQT